MTSTHVETRKSFFGMINDTLNIAPLTVSTTPSEFQTHFQTATRG